MSNVTFLDVPFRDKDIVKSLGARWNPKAKKWCVPAGVDLTAFKKWLPKTENDRDKWALAPIYLVESTAGCWQCDRSVPVITLLSEGVEFKSGEKPLTEICVFDYIRFIPLKLEKFLAKRFSNYFKDYSSTTHDFYFMNHCFCGAHLGDFYLHGEPDGAFFPLTEKACENIFLTELKSDGKMPIFADYSLSSHDLIYHHARRKPLSTLINLGSRTSKSGK